MSVPNEREDDYLWDKSGPLDPEVARLERVLARYRYDARGDDFERKLRPRVAWRRWVVALAAGVAIVLAARVWLVSSDSGAAYEVLGVAGIARIGVGDHVETGADHEAVVRVATLGQVFVQPGSRLRVDDAGAQAHRMFLERGAVRAKIFGRPREFQIGTPAGLSVDLGCEYELDVDEQGRSTMTVLTGRVAFEAAGRRVLVPADTTCTATREGGPDVPVRVGANAELVSAVRAIERSAEPDSRDVATVLAADVREHSVTLWHLFALTSSPDLRAALFTLLSKTYPLPADVDLAALKSGDAAAAEAWRASFEVDWR